MQINRTSNQNKKIAKNSLYLYIRTFISIIVTLYTSRIFLEQLGIEDFGIYNLVASIISILAVMSSLMSSSMLRFLSIEIGRDNIEQMNKVFNICIMLQIFIAFLFVIICEIFGLYLLNYVLVIPSEKIYIAKVVFHMAIATSFINLLKIPYNALIIAKERMSFYAYISIIEVLSKLVITYLLILLSNKLVSFSWMLFVVAIFITTCYIIYCIVDIGLPKFKHYSINENLEYKEILKFSGWGMLGNTAIIIKDQGVGFILNIYFGVMLNAAMGIMLQVSNVYSTLFLNLQAAFRPQIIQNSISDKNRCLRLVEVCSFYSILLMGFVCIPMIIACPTILSLWLGNIPLYTTELVQILMFKILLSSYSQSIYVILEAFGDIKRNQIVSAIIYPSTLMISYIMLYFGLPPYIVIVIMVLAEAVLLLYRLYYINKQSYCNVIHLLFSTYKIIIVAISFSIFAVLFSRYQMTLLQTLLELFVCILIYGIAAFLTIEKSQRILLVSSVKRIISK